MAALEQSDRVCSISLTVSRSLLNRLSTISKPFSVLEELRLDRSQYSLESKPLSEHLWGPHLRTLHTTGFSLPSLPRLPCQDLVDLRLHKITMPYFPPEAFANAICGMTQLQSLSLHFLFLIPRQKYLYFPPPPVGRILLPALIYFKYQGISKYLDTLVPRIDAPCLRDIDITFVSRPTLDASQLGRFINRMETWTSPLQADIVFAERAISVTFTKPGADALARLRIQISCEQLDWQLFSISQICDQFSSFLFGVKDLRIKSVRLPSLPDDMVDEQWLRLIRAFDGAKDFYVADEIGIDIMHALQSSDEGHKSALPALQNLCVQGPILTHRPMGALVESFVTQCRLSGHPVQIFYVSWATAEEVSSAKRWVEGQKRLAFHRSFDGVQGSSVPESEIQEYTRKLEHLDMLLSNIEEYIHIAFAALGKEDVVRRMFTMMASTKFQLEENKKLNPRYVLELHTIRGMIQEAGSMDKGLRTALHLKAAPAQSNPSVPRPL